MHTVLRNAFVYTADAGHTCFAHGALLILDGQVVWVGDEADLPPVADARVLDLGGRVVMPGLVNTHAHGGMSLHRACCDDGDLLEWASVIAPHTSTLTLDEARSGCYLAVLEMVRHGITTACDCTRYGAGIFSEVASDVGMRSLSGALANSPSLRPDGRPNWPLALDETRTAIEARGSDPRCRFYLGAHSPYSCTPDLLVEVKAQARSLGLPFVIHVAECRAEVGIVQQRYGHRPVQHLHRLGVLDRESILAHCVWLDEDEIDLLVASGAGVSHNPVSNAKLASGTAPVPALRRKGVPVGLGTDSAVSNNSLSIFQEMKFAVLLQRAHHLDGHVLTARDSLRMATIEGARVLGWDAEIGSLEAGKQADLVVLDLEHPLGLTVERVISDLVYAAHPRQIHAVMVAGETIFEQSRFTRVDEAAINARIRAHGGA